MKKEKTSPMLEEKETALKLIDILKGHSFYSATQALERAAAILRQRSIVN